MKITLLLLILYQTKSTTSTPATIPNNSSVTSELTVRNTTTTYVESTTSLSSISTNHSVEELLEKNERPDWFKEALKDIAYYLRAHKFNEYDRRYTRDASNADRVYFQHFPIPPLRTLHWEVHRYCESSFLHCIDYLRKKLKHVALKRQDDTVVAALENHWNINSTQVKQTENECKKMRQIDDQIADPFEGPLERYQWRSTASYFMCWYTMNEVPDLMHLNEQCDNFAYCLDNATGLNNGDLRAEDSKPFACAQYSFCPDPCCPQKHLTKKEFCWDNEKNPCFHENPTGRRECGLIREENKEFSDLILNRWNVSCFCPNKGQIWSSLYGICVDIDECSDSKLHKCNAEGQACMNTVGSYRCVCTWGYYYDEESKKCIKSQVISSIKLNSQPKVVDKNGTNQWRVFVRTVLKLIGPTSSSSSFILHWLFRKCYFLFIIVTTFIK